MQGFEKSSVALEFDKIIEGIAGKCVSVIGGERLRNSQPIQEPGVLHNLLKQISELREIYLTEGGIPIWDFVDVRPLFSKIEPEGSYLEIEQFVQLQNVLELVEELIQFQKKMDTKFPVINTILSRFIPLQKLLHQFHFTFESAERVFDNASPELKSIRKELSKLDIEIHTRLERVMRKASEHIQDEYLTLRDGRLVLPVREFSVTKVPGIVHGQSGSGATYFVEPMAVVELNNDIQKLAAAERKEIIRILKRLSDQVREEESVFLANQELLIQLDVIQAKAREANQFNCTEPEIAQNFEWNLIRARHPILLKLHPDTIVPLNIQAGGAFNELIISGPNAGGKTVAIKTIGLLQLLFQSGFHIPVAEGSQLPICKQMFAVIGDDQSIENDLSTFSSHLQALQEILNLVQSQSLVLIDEIGNGTEPAGGAALAIAILEKLNLPEIVTIATTHQNQLKYYASETDGVQNASMQFDTVNLRPLFTLETGIPGSSHTFEISKRMGLDEKVINRAIELSGRESFELDKLLSEVSDSIRKYNMLKNALSIKESELNGLTQLYKVKSDTLSSKRKKFEKEAKEESRKILEDVNKEVERVIREIRESQADKQVVKKARARLNSLKSELKDSSATSNAVSLSLEDLKAGQRARSIQYGISGKVSRIFKGKKEVELEKDGLKITIPLKDVELLDAQGQVVQMEIKEAAAGEAPAINVSNELDLRGLMTEEAIRETERYIDAAILSNWSEVRLVHGKGTGALRKAIHQYLSQLKTIKSYRLGRWGEGDSGVTVVDFGGEKNK